MFDLLLLWDWFPYLLLVAMIWYCLSWLYCFGFGVDDGYRED